MKYGFMRAAAATPVIKVAECEYNALKIIELIKEANDRQTELAVFPELCITGYTCGDLFFQTKLIDDAFEQLLFIAKETSELNIIAVVGLPVLFKQKLYNCAAVLKSGEILGIVTKSILPNYAVLCEKRHFTTLKENDIIICGKKKIPFGPKILFRSVTKRNQIFAVEICEDLWAPLSPSTFHAIAGATIIANLSASYEQVAKDAYRQNLVASHSAKLLCAYVYSSAGEGESTTDLVYSAHNIISENGSILAEAKRFENGLIYADLDLDYLAYERLHYTSFNINDDSYCVVDFEQKDMDCELNRAIPRHPFIPEDTQLIKTCEDIFTIQAYGLKKRLEHLRCDTVVLGVSGGLDSTLALIAVARCFDLLKYDKKNIHTLTVPCFGTTSRTLENSKKLANAFGTTLLEINITESVLKHFEDIGHDKNIHDLTYENAQARERTQVFMDYASRVNGIVIGTGDLSELALGFATYNGDHMSMYNINASIPKTLVRQLIKYFADTSASELKDLLYDILDTPVSPELLPPDELQITENIVGPYELNDFFLYNLLAYGYEPKKIYYLATQAFNDYPKETILQWLKRFYARFFTQQYKRSCMPDGPKVGCVTLSPRGDFKMPSDACKEVWLRELNSIKNLE